MNRIQNRPVVTPQISTLAAPDVSLVRYHSSPEDIPHALFAPLHYEANYAYPLIVWLHGTGDNEHQLKRVMPLVSLRNYIAIAPRGVEPLTEEGHAAGFGWSQDEELALTAEQRVLDSIAIAQDSWNVHPRRIFLAGLGAGGTMAYRIALAHPHRFAGVISLGGGFPARHRLFAQLEDVRKVPLLVICGRDSIDYPASHVCNDLRLFHAAGMSVSVRQYPCGDDVTNHMLSDVDRWIMEQVTGPSPSCTQTQEKT